MKFNLNKFNINAIFTLLILKLTFSYLDIELGWWLRHLTPDSQRFNFLGLKPGFSGKIEYVLFPLIIFYVVNNFKKLGNYKVTFFLTTFLFSFNIITSYINNQELINSITYSLKICSPIYFLFVLETHFKSSHLELKLKLKKLIMFIFFLALIAFCIFNVSYNRGHERLPIYFSGLHTHNYILSIAFVTIAYFLKDKRYYLLSFLIASFSFLLIGYNVRTPLIFYFIFSITTLYYASNSFKRVYAFLFVASPIFLALLYLNYSNYNFDEFSSGRITMYKEKLNMISRFNTKEVLFGRGWGTDLISTDKWWYEKKSSHNDYLTLIVENGIIYLLFFLLTIFSLLLTKKHISIFLIALILGYLTTSFFSNGIALRPLVGYMFFMTYALISTKNNFYE